MRTAILSAVVAAATFGCAGGAFAQDEAPKRSSPWAVFKFGFSAYKNGHKDQAVEAYRYAAENGQIGATWKLARMYAKVMASLVTTTRLSSSSTRSRSRMSSPAAPKRATCQMLWLRWVDI